MTIAWLEILESCIPNTRKPIKLNWSDWRYQIALVWSAGAVCTVSVERVHLADIEYHAVDIE